MSLTVRRSTFDNVVGAADYRAGKTDNIEGIQVSNAGKTVTIKFTKVFCPATAALGGAGAGGILPSKAFKAQWDNKTTDTTKNIDDVPFNMNPPASIGPVRNPFSCKNDDDPLSCWGDPQKGRPSDDGQNPFRYMLKTSIWALTGHGRS